MKHALLAVLVLSGMACGARTQLKEGSPRHDAGPPDMGRDASFDGGIDGGPDMGFDAGPDTSVAVGPPCRADRDCDGLRCVRDREAPPVDLEPIELRCQSLAVIDDGALCDRLGECGRGLCALAGSCVPPCVDDGDCSTEERCRRVFIPTSDDAMQPMSACVSIFDLPPGVEGSVLPTVRLGGGAAEARLPGLGLYLFEGHGGDFAVTSLRAEGGPTLFDIFQIGPTPPLNPISTGPYPTQGFPIPSGLEVVSAASYLVGLESLGAAMSTSVYRIVDQRSARGNVLDVDLFYSASRLRGDEVFPALRRALEDVAVLHRLELGQVRVHNLVGGLREQYLVLEADDETGWPELPELFALSAGAARPSIPIFFVDDLGIAIGVAGGAPAAMGSHGTAMSGLAIAMELLDPAIGLGLERVMAHEVGHFLGLFHTTDLDGTVMDPLPDTPVCTLTQDTDADGLLLPFECEGFGANNLMFWSPAGDTLSAQQRQIVGRAVVLQ